LIYEVGIFSFVDSDKSFVIPNPPVNALLLKLK
jgi:hypothetical protein